MRDILRVDMTTQTITTEPFPAKWAKYGGRALTAAIIAEEVPALAHPLGANNKLVVAPGLLSGTTAPISGRLSVGCKSPLTGGIKESNAGGQAAQALGMLGIAAIIVEGKPEKGKLYKLVLKKGEYKLEPAEQYKLMDNYALVEVLKQEYGEKNVAFITIGSAGERLLTAASIAVTDPEMRPTRHAGRGGPGAVMGAKGLKAIICNSENTERRVPADTEAFRAASRKFTKALSEHPVTSEGLPNFGTNILANIINEAGGYPTRNFSATGRFPEVEKVSGETQSETMKSRGGMVAHGCHRGCVIRCSGLYNDKDGKYLSKRAEYETVWAFGPNCGISDLDMIHRLDYSCDDIGLDTIEMGAAVAVAMDGGIRAFGDAEGALSLLEEVRKGTPLGRILGSGTYVTGQVLGVERVPTVKKQALPAYDPRAIKGIGVTYATSTMGADHTAGYCIATNILGVGGKVDPLGKEGQVELSRNLQIATAAIDSTGLCLFVAFAVLDKPEAFEGLYEMLNSFYGWNLTGADVAELGKTVLRAERDFNRRAGFTKQDDRLPEFFNTVPIAPHNVTFDMPDEELDQVFNF
jgi:aldehyde:ferredoxin oxidoreductase